MVQGADSGILNKLTSMDQQLRIAFSKVKEEFEEHLDSINQNADETQQNYEFLIELENKLEKLNSRVDDLQMLMKEVVLNQIEVTRLDDGKSMKLSQFVY